MPTPMDLTSVEVPQEVFRWEPIDGEAITVGMYVRGTGRRDLHWSPMPVQGEVVEISENGEGLSLDGDAGGEREIAARRWEQRLSQSVLPADGAWVDAEVGEFAVGDKVRVTSRSTGAVDEGVVASLSCSTGEGDPALLVRKSDGVEQCRHARYRTYQRWVPAHSSPAWVPVTDPSTLAAGDYVRGTAVSDGSVAEGRFDRLTSNGRIMLAGMSGQYFTAPEIRRWERLVATSDPGGTWVRTEANDFEVGDRVRVTHRRTGMVHEGTVFDVPGGGWLSVDHGASTPENFSAEYRTFEKWAPATPSSSPTTEVTGWVPVVDYSTLNVGDVVRATPNGIGGRMQATVSRSDRHWFNAITTHVITESRNRWARDLEGWAPYGYLYGDVRDTEVWRGTTPAPEPIDTVVRAAFRAPQVGDTFTRTHTDSGFDDRPNCTVTRIESPPGLDGGWRVEYRAEGVRRGTIHVRPSGEVTNTGGGRPGRYVLTEPAPRPTPLVSAEQVRAAAAPVGEVPIPEWATSLDAAKRHVHAQARRLYRSGDNCYDGSSDFVNGLDLPGVRDDYPAPEVVDESAQIREFLTKVREVALYVARDHGKSISLVEGWLSQQGIVEPPPAEVQHTVTFTAPADANVAQVLRDLGWQVRSNPFD